MGLFLAVLIVMVSRAPLLLESPRFWAEEGSVHFAYAYQHPWAKAILLVPTTEGPAGYLHLSANLAATAAAHAVPLEWAPLITTLIALALQLLPFALLIFGRSALWRSSAERLPVVAVLLFAPVANREAWLNSTNSQVFCGVAALLVLTEELGQGGRGRRWTLRGCLGLGGLSGAYTVLLLPAFVVRHRLVRCREALVHVGIVAACALVQAVAFVWTIAAGALGPPRFAELRLAGRAAGALQGFVATPLLGEIVGGKLVEAVGLGAVARGADLSAGGALAVSVAAAAIFGAIFVSLARQRPSAETPLVIALVTLFLLVPALAFGGAVSGRYSVVPATALLLLLLASASSDRCPRRHLAARVLLGVSFVIGVTTFWWEVPLEVQGRVVGHFGRTPGRPEWRQEVAAWRRDAERALRIWPYSHDRSWELFLQRGFDFAEEQRRLAAGCPLDVVARAGEVGSRELKVAGLPPEFKLVLEVIVSQPSARVEVEVVLVDEAGRRLASQTLHDYRQDRPTRLQVDSRRLWRADGGRFSATRAIVLRLSARVPEPVRCRVSRVFLTRRVEGILDAEWLGAFAERSTRQSPRL